MRIEAIFTSSFVTPSSLSHNPSILSPNRSILSPNSFFVFTNSILISSITVSKSPVLDTLSLALSFEFLPDELFLLSFIKSGLTSKNFFDSEIAKFLLFKIKLLLAFSGLIIMFFSWSPIFFYLPFFNL